MNYNKLITKSFIDLDVFNQYISDDEVIDILQDFYNEYAFSTFPYNKKLSSHETYKQYNSGNCIALSFALQNILKKKNINSYLIPATIPNIYRHPKYLDISHVALAIPNKKHNRRCVTVVDTAFYFLNPINSYIDNFNSDEYNNIVFSKSIYEEEFANDLKNYKTINKIINYTNKLDEDKQFNKWQTILKDTYYTKCHYLHNILDTWSYYFTSIVNPDECISDFFLKIKNEPFICACKNDNNSICKSYYYIKKQNDGYLYIKHNGIAYKYKLNDIPNNIIDDLNKNLYKYFKGNIYDFL